MYLNRRHARTHFSDNSVIRDVMMETCDLCISVLRAGASRLHVSHVVVGTERIWRIPHRWGVLRLSPASSVSRRRAVRDGGAHFGGESRPSLRCGGPLDGGSSTSQASKVVHPGGELSVARASGDLHDGGCGVHGFIGFSLGGGSAPVSK
jgi:hypothetical protein